MNVVKEVAKSKEQALELVKEKLGDDEIIYSFREIKGGLFKGISYECTGYLKQDVIDGAKEFLKNIIKAWNIDADILEEVHDDVVTLRISTDNNALVIGKNGKNLESLMTLIRQYVSLNSNNTIKITLDVENYKQKQEEKIVRLAKKIAREVEKTKIDVIMDDMNAYDRRIVHSALKDYKNIKTESTGEEPNRHIVIKYVE